MILVSSPHILLQIGGLVLTCTFILFFFLNKVCKICVCSRYMFCFSSVQYAVLRNSIYLHVQRFSKLRPLSSSYSSAEQQLAGKISS